MVCITQFTVANAVSRASVKSIVVERDLLYGHDRMFSVQMDGNAPIQL